ncbi:hypothetical protein [Streptosporangium sp. NPDC002524]|uniref:hypothetical protein n=1 Tax=Streptosporangium sp. NPDC002524 TaxID=3154537 RepID=UPI00332AC69F
MSIVRPVRLLSPESTAADVLPPTLPAEVRPYPETGVPQVSLRTGGSRLTN